MPGNVVIDYEYGIIHVKSYTVHGEDKADYCRPKAEYLLMVNDGKEIECLQQLLAP